MTAKHFVDSCAVCTLPLATVSRGACLMTSDDVNTLLLIHGECSRIPGKPAGKPELGFRSSKGFHAKVLNPEPTSAPPSVIRLQDRSRDVKNLFFCNASDSCRRCHS